MCVLCKVLLYAGFLWLVSFWCFGSTESNFLPQLCLTPFCQTNVAQNCYPLVYELRALKKIWEKRSWVNWTSVDYISCYMAVIHRSKAELLAKRYLKVGANNISAVAQCPASILTGWNAEWRSPGWIYKGKYFDKEILWEPMGLSKWGLWWFEGIIAHVDP